MIPQRNFINPFLEGVALQIAELTMFGIPPGVIVMILPMDRGCCSTRCAVAPDSSASMCSRTILQEADILDTRGAAAKYEMRIRSY